MRGGPQEQGTLEISMAHDENKEEPMIELEARTDGASTVLEEGKMSGAESGLREELRKFLSELKAGMVIVIFKLLPFRKL